MRAEGRRRRGASGAPEHPGVVRVCGPSSGAEIRPERVREDIDRVGAWLRDYVSRPDPRVGRAGPVCPFVPPALQQDAVGFSLRYETDGGTEAAIREAVAAELADFDATAESLPRSGSSPHSRVVVFPLLGPDGWRRLDSVYESLKNAAVSKGLMTGQFHPLCDERAARNPAFRVSVAPVGLYAIRRMATHDVLFLHERREWFVVYDRLFRSHYEGGRVRDPLLCEVHEKAVARHGLPPLVCEPG